MAGMTHQLMEILEAEIDNYNKLLEFSIQKTPIIIKGDVKELREITKKENQIIFENQKLEKERITLMSDIAMVLNKDEKTLTLSELINILSNQNNQNEECKNLKDIRDRLKEVLNTLKNNNDKNGVLLNEALNYVDFNINVVQSAKALPPLLYQYGGVEKQSEGRNFFDRKS